MVGSKHEAMGPIWWKESRLFLTPNLFLGSAEGTPSIALLFNTRGFPDTYGPSVANERSRQLCSNLACVHFPGSGHDPRDVGDPGYHPRLEANSKRQDPPLKEQDSTRAAA